jgi:hypothetical protein
VKQNKPGGKMAKPKKFTVVVHIGGNIKKVKSKSFASRDCAHKYATRMMCKSSFKKPIRAVTKLNK